MDREKEITGATILGIILMIAFAIKLAKALLPFFVFGTVLSLIGVVIILILLFREDVDETIALIGGGVFLFFVLGTLVCYGIGYGFGESSLGRAATDIADAFNLVEETQKNATLTIIDETQKATSEVIHSTNGTSDVEKASNTSYDLLKKAVEIS